MGRQKTDRKIGNHTEEQMRNALQAIKGGKSIRHASKEFDIPFTTLQRYSKLEDGHHLIPNYAVRKVFTHAQETSLRDYFVKCALMFYGLTTKDCRKIAYEMAKQNNVAIPANWEEKQMAGIDWLRGFRERFPDLSLRRPENCSLARATAFNKETVKIFFDNLENVLARSPVFADGTRIYNLDETATTTVQKNPRVLAPKGKINVCKVTSGEKGTLVTTCNIISAGGCALPPAIVFPRKKVNPRMKVGAPPGSLILAASSGWMNSEIFVDVMKHFIQRSGSSKEFPSVLIMDNHESHLSIEALDLAKDSGVTVLTLHPHTSAKLQPLDVGVYAPFKAYYAAAMESWMMRNPGCPVTIYDLGALIGQAFEKSMTPINIKNAFKKTGIYPFDRDVFSEEDFMPSSVTDRPIIEEPAAEAIEIDENMRTPTVDLENMSMEILPWDEATPSPSIIDALQDSISRPLSTPIESVPPSTPNKLITSTPLPLSNMCLAVLSASSTNMIPEAAPQPSFSNFRPNTIVESSVAKKKSVDSPTSAVISYSHTKVNLSARLITPDEFRNPLKAAARKKTRKPRRLGKSFIATDTPEKDEIRMNKMATKRKKESKSTGKKAVRKVLQSNSKITVKKSVRKEVLESDSEEDCDIYLDDDSLDEWSWCGDDDNDENENYFVTQETLMKPLPRLPKEGEYVLIEFASKQQKIYYVAKVLEERNDNLDFYVSYLRHKKGRFTMPPKPDLASVRDDNIKYLLPTPTSNGSTARQQSYLTFSVDLTYLNVR